MGVTKQGLAANVKTRGNHGVHVIHCGGGKGTNYDADSMQAAVRIPTHLSWSTVTVRRIPSSFLSLFDPSDNYLQHEDRLYDYRSQFLYHGM